MSIQESFHCIDAIKLNIARINHLKTLNLNFDNKNILETGCGGRGDITKFLLEKNSNVTLNDYRIENINYLKSHIFVNLPYNTWDLNSEELPSDKIFDIILCYGTLYHLEKPFNAIKCLSSLCKEYIIISTCTSGRNDPGLNLVYEGDSPTQSYTSYGCRPGRLFVYEELKKNFKYVYMLKTQPDHEDYPLCFPSSNHASRNIFIGSHIILDNELFIDYIPYTYTL